jgi:3-oxoacyl-[acyl-carrier protein] reductase
MNDVLLEVSKSAATRKLVQTLGLPIPLPEPLARAKGPWTAMPLEHANVVVGAKDGSLLLLSQIAATLAEAGASILVEDDLIRSTIAEVAEAYARPVRREVADDQQKAQALVFDATGIENAAGLRALLDFFGPRVKRLARSGRLVVLGRAGCTEQLECAAAQAALSGFVRSAAKELGRKGATANLILVEQGAESRVGPVLRWLLDKHSAFVSAQPFIVSKVAKHPSEKGEQQSFFSYVRPLDGQVAVVTGAARGIGRATATALANEGASVWCVDRPEDGEETSKVARKLGGFPLLLDVTSKNAVAEIKDAVGARGLDVIVHNAGITRDKTLARMEQAQWDLVIAINLEAVVRITEGLESTLRDAGRVICVSSVSGIAGNVGQTNYAASKAALIGYVDALAKRLGHRGITANAVAPGFIETRMTSAIPLVIRQAGRVLSALGQGGEPEDVAALITFLASPGAQGITGRTIRVCGGALIGA